MKTLNKIFKALDISTKHEKTLAIIIMICFGIMLIRLITALW